MHRIVDIMSYRKQHIFGGMPGVLKLQHRLTVIFIGKRLGDISDTLCRKAPDGDDVGRRDVPVVLLGDREHLLCQLPKSFKLRECGDVGFRVAVKDNGRIAFTVE